jgi:ketosteroid isomerase-like protein
MDENTYTIREIYAAFGTGDVPAILERVTDDTEWGFNVKDGSVPWHQTVRGKDSLPQFFANLQDMEISAFEPREFIASGDHVIVDLHIAYKVKSTGKMVDERQLQWWTLDAQHRVSRLLHFEDTAQVLAASR